MPKYFKFLGWLELILAIIGFFYFIFNIAALQSILHTSESSSSAGIDFLGILSLIIYAIFAPALGLLLIAFGETLEKIREIRNAQLEAGQFTTEEKDTIKDQILKEIKDKIEE